MRLSRLLIQSISRTRCGQQREKLARKVRIPRREEIMAAAEEEVRKTMATKSWRKVFLEVT